MPIKIPNDLPASKTLTNEHIFVMNEEMAFHQDIRPLQILILNLMPTKIVTETQLLASQQFSASGRGHIPAARVICIDTHACEPYGAVLQGFRRCEG